MSNYSSLLARVRAAIPPDTDIMNYLQDLGLVSDCCVHLEDVATSDLERAADYLETL